MAYGGLNKYMDAAVELGRNLVIGKHQLQPEHGDEQTGLPNLSRETKFSGANDGREKIIVPVQLTTSRIGNITRLTLLVVFTLKTVLTSIQYPSLSYSSRQRNEFPWSQANPK